jgi:hypothetical protein
MFSASLLAISGSQLWISQMARSYTLLQMLITANSILMLATTPSLLRLVVCFAISTASFYCHGAAQLAVPVQLVAIAITGWNKWSYVMAGMGGAFAYMPFLLMHPRIGAVAHHLNWVDHPSLTSVLRFPAMIVFGREIDTVAISCQLTVALMITVLIAGIVTSGRLAAAVGLQWCFAWTGAIASLVSGLEFVTVERYFAPAFVCQAVAVPLALERPSFLPVAMSRFMGIALCGAYAISFGLYFMFPPATPWREMAGVITNNRLDGELVVVAAPMVRSTPFAHYYRGPFLYQEVLQIGTAESTKGVWICFNEIGEKAEGRVISGNVRRALPFRKEVRFHRGMLIYLSRNGTSNDATDRKAARG